MDNGTTNREAYLKRILSLWNNYPELRFGQLLLNSVLYSDDLYYMTDEELLKLLEHRANS